MKKKIGIKLLRKYGKHYCSVSCDVKRIYKVGKITGRRKGCGPLAVFESIFYAERFAKRIGLDCSKVFAVQCEYLPSTEWVLYYPSILDGKRIIKYHGHSHLDRQSNKFLPEGTVTADWIHFVDYPKPINLF